MKRKFRLARSTDFKRVRRSGKSYAHPLIVLVALPNSGESSRFGVAAGRTVGNAVYRNRAKRLIRAAVQPLIPVIAPGWDVVIIARQPLASAALAETQAALTQLLRRAHLITKTYDHGSTS